LSSPEIIDTHQFERTHAGAAYHVHGRKHALIDSGTSLSAPYIQSALHGVRIDYIFVTHIHLDHAGGAGVLAHDSPHTTVVVHPRGARHLVDPTQLVASVRDSTGAMFSMYGQAVPIQQSQLHSASDGERFDLGDGVMIEAIYSPGHAPHHLCLFEHRARLLFVGDAAGSFHDGHLYCSTPPPAFNLDDSLRTVERLRSLGAERLFYAHFGPSDDADSRLAQYADLLPQWVAGIDKHRNGRSVPELIDDVLADPRLVPAAFDPVLRPELEMSIRGVLHYLERA